MPEVLREAGEVLPDAVAVEELGLHGLVQPVDHLQLHERGQRRAVRAAMYLSIGSETWAMTCSRPSTGSRPNTLVGLSATGRDRGGVVVPGGLPHVPVDDGPLDDGQDLQQRGRGLLDPVRLGSIGIDVYGSS